MLLDLVCFEVVVLIVLFKCVLFDVLRLFELVWCCCVYCYCDCDCVMLTGVSLLCFVVAGLSLVFAVVGLCWVGGLTWLFVAAAGGFWLLFSLV